MTDREKGAKLSKLLADAEKQVRRCDELNPWGGIETRGAFLKACSAGADLIAKLYRIDPDIIGKSRRLKALSQLDLDPGAPGRKRKRPTGKASVKRRSQTWGRILEVITDASASSEPVLSPPKGQRLAGAAKFAASLAEEKKKWSKDQEYRVTFKACSEKLAGCLLYDILDVLAEYDPEEYPHLRLQVLGSYLKELRVEFLWDACARGPCRTDSIPAQCRFEKLPDNLRGQLAVLHGEDQHKFTFCTDTGQEYECLTNNTGIKNYRALLDNIWDSTTGKSHSYPQDGSAVWAIVGHERVQNLEAYASLIARLLRPLSRSAKHSECARTIKAIITTGRGRWCKRTHIKWSYLNDLDKLIAELDA